VKRKEVAEELNVFFQMDQQQPQQATQPKEQLYQAIKNVGGLKGFGAVFFAVYKHALSTRETFVLDPDEFFYIPRMSPAMHEGLKKLQKTLADQKHELFLQFYRDHMDEFEPELVVETLISVLGKDIDEQMFKDLIAACNDPGNRYHNEKADDE
jgi:hypothetical protein